MFDRRAHRAFYVVASTLLIAAAGFYGAISWLNLVLQKERVDLRDQFVNMARSIDPFTSRSDRILDPAVVESLGTENYLSRVYIAEDGTPIEFHLAYYTGLIDAIPHVPDRCFLAAGMKQLGPPENLPLRLGQEQWSIDDERTNGATGLPYRYVHHRDPITGRPLTVRMPVGEPDDFAIRTVEFEIPERPGSRVYGGYFFVANGRITPKPEAVKLLAFDIGDRYAYYCKVQLTMHFSAENSKDVYIDHVSRLLESFMPELMRCLPDWSDVERLDESQASS